MQKEIKKVFSLSVLVFGVVLLTGCGAKTEAPKANDASIQKNSTEQKVKDTSGNNANANANLNNNSAASADNEESLLSREESEAGEALSGSEDLNDLSNTYDENNL
jgi:hypothetical protein